ncbi:MAG: JAB domain-containing protein [Chlamydiia bacterium]
MRKMGLTLDAPLLTSPETVFLEIKQDFFGETREICMVLGRDREKKILFKEVIGSGGGSFVQCAMKDFFIPALREGANEIIVIHNHLERHLAPSKNDLISTKALIEASELLGITFVDHLIVHQESFLSMYVLGHIPERGDY